MRGKTPGKALFDDCGALFESLTVGGGHDARWVDGRCCNSKGSEWSFLGSSGTMVPRGSSNHENAGESLTNVLSSIILVENGHPLSSGSNAAGLSCCMKPSRHAGLRTNHDLAQTQRCEGCATITEATSNRLRLAPHSPGSRPGWVNWSLALGGNTCCELRWTSLSCCEVGIVQ